MAENNWFIDLLNNAVSVLTPGGRNRITADVVADPGAAAAEAIFSTSALGRATGGPLASQTYGSLPRSTSSTADYQPNWTSQIAERGRVRGRQGLADMRAPEQQATGGGGGGPSISDIFAPLFEALDQQRRNAESRYTSNVGQIQNIYGQIIGARTSDIDSIEKAYERLQTAAASRGAATISGIQGREAARQSGNEAVIQSMGLGDVALPTSDVASDASAAAQDVAALNQANWAGMLGAMGATSQDIARADIAGYGYRQGEDIATLTGAKEDYLQNIANQEFELKFQEQQQKLAMQQAAAAAAAQAQQDALDTAARAQEQSYSNFLRYSDPLTQSLVTAAEMGVISPEQVARSSDAFNTFMGQVYTATPPSGMTQWNGASAASAFLTSPAAEGLTTMEKNIITQAIRSSF